MDTARINDALASLSDRLAESMDRRCFWWFALFSLGYFALTLSTAAAKHFWLDELVTCSIAGAPRLQDIWETQRLSIDQTPVGFFVVTRATMRLSPIPELGARLPAVLGMWLMSLCVFCFVKRRVGTPWGLSAVLAVLVTGAYPYAFEARPYGLVMGFYALSLFCWQLACDGKKRALSLPGIALGVAGAISSNYFAVLVVVPLAIGECARTLRRRRADWAVWIAIAAGASVSFAYTRRVSHIVERFTGRSWGSPYATVSLDLYLSLLGDVAPILAALLLVGALCIATGITTRGNKAESAWAETATHEMAAAFGLLILPFVAHAVAKYYTNAIAFRYVLPATIGFSLVLVYFLFRATRGSKITSFAFLAVLMMGFLLYQGLLGRYGVKRANAQAWILRGLLANRPSDLPIAVDDPLMASVLFRYESPEVTRRLYFVAGRRASQQYGSTPYWGTMWLRWQQFAPLRAETVEDFFAHHKEFLIYSTGSEFCYLAPKLIADGETVEVLAATGRSCLYRVRPKGTP